MHVFDITYIVKGTQHEASYFILTSSIIYWVVKVGNPDISIVAKQEAEVVVTRRKWAQGKNQGHRHSAT